MIVDVLAGEAAAQPRHSRLPVCGPSGEGSGQSVAGPGLRAAGWARPQSGSRSWERRACALSSGVCGLWGALRASKEGRVAQLGESRRMGRLAPAGGGRAPQPLGPELLRALGFPPPTY